MGNVFSTTDDWISEQDLGFNPGVIEGSHMQLVKQGDETSFNWAIATSVDAFGFFARNNDAGIITINFNDSAAKTYSMTALQAGNGDNLFWGISGLDGTVSSVDIASTDPGASSNGRKSTWDRFVYRKAKREVSVPEPGTLALLGIGLLGLGLSRRGS